MSTVEFGGDVVSITQAARLLGVSVRTVQRRLDKGTLKAVIEGDTRRVRLGDTSRDTATNDAPQGDRGATVTSDATRHSDATQGDTSRDSDAIAQAVQLARIEGYLARDMSKAVAQAVTEATAPMMALIEAQAKQSAAMLAHIETMNENNAELLKEVAELRADKNADAVHRAKVEELLAILATPKPEVLSTVEIAPGGANSSSAGKEAGGGGSGQHAQPRPLWKLILGVR